ncbi:MAG: beta-propeller fold lactonase family protein, partial [Aeromicrobium sp.]|nr:beta-propeller fold lactonase family protein [Burkholderiales bacterium]
MKTTDIFAPLASRGSVAELRPSLAWLRPRLYALTRAAMHTSRLVFACFALLTLLGVGVAAAGPFAYVTNDGSNNVSVVDLATRAVVSTIPVGGRPYGVGASPTGNFVYVTNYADGTVSIISTSTNLVVATVSVGGPGSQASAIAVNRDGSSVFIGSASSANVSVIDTTNNSVTTPESTGRADDLALSPSDNRLYVSSSSGNKVTVINRPTNNILRTITNVPGAFGMAVHPDGRRLYVGNSTGNVLTVINTQNNSINASIALPSAQYGLAISPSGDKLYVSHHLTNQITVIDTAANRVLTTFTVTGKPLGLSLDSTGSTLVVARSDANAISIFATSTYAQTAAVTVGTAPQAFGRMVVSTLSGLTAPSITTNNSPASGVVSVAYAGHQFTASGTAPFQWTVQSGVLPPGLTLSVTGELSGTPTQAGTFNFALQATNGFGTPDTASFSLVVAPAPEATQIAQAISFGTAPEIAVGGTGTVSATGGASGNAVTFTSTTTGVCTVSGTNGSTVTGVTAGTCTIAATQASNTNYAAASQVT